MDIALDTSILFADFWLRSQKMRALTDFATKTHSKILLTEVVIRELRAHVRRNFEGETAKVNTAIRQAERNGISGFPEIASEQILQRALTKWDKNFARVFPPEITIEIPLDNRVLPEAIRRATERIRPCKDTGEGIRDAIIWLNLLGFCASKRKKRAVAFISSNTSDFAGADKVSLHEELANDIKLRKVNIVYFASLDDFLKAHAEPIAHINMEWVKAHLDIGKAEEVIREYMNKWGLEDKYLYDGAYYPIGKPIITSMKLELAEVHVWKFGEHQIDIELSFDVEVKADIVGQSHHTSDFSVMPGVADLRFDVAAEVVGENISFKNVERIQMLKP